MSILKHITFLLVVLLLVSSCEKDQELEGSISLTLVDQFPINVPEPSGLSFSSSGSALYTVSDHTGQIYRLDFNGQVKSTFEFTGTDLEGITVNPENGHIWIVEERSRRLIELSAGGKLIKSTTIDVEQNEVNSGLEGVTFNPGNGHMFILNEKIPGKLIELNHNGVKIRETMLDFASNYSGIFYEQEDNILWVVSSESKTVNRCTLEGSLIESYRLPISNAEGIVVQPLERKIYLVSDTREKLYVFRYE